mgnify:CR=1 FL=1
MAYFCEEVSRTFSEYLLIPNLTTKQCLPSNVSLKTPVVKFKKGEKSPIEMNIPVTSAIMQSVSGPDMAIGLSKEGGVCFIYGSQAIETQAEMVQKVKKYKSGFVVSNANLTPRHTLRDVVKVKERTGHSTIAITEDGSPAGKLLGIVTSRDYRLSRDSMDKKVEEFMTPFSKLIYGKAGISLSEANDLIWANKLNSLPIVDDQQNLVYLVFRKDYDEHKQNPLQLLDKDKRFIVGAGINTKDYQERVPALVEAGVDMVSQNGRKRPFSI